MELFYHSVFRWIGRRRGEVTVLIALIFLSIDLFWLKEKPLDLLRFQPSFKFFLCWVLLLTGVCLRIWAAGNLRKNEEITMTGIYAMMRHPLYLGTPLIYLSFLLAAGNTWVALIAFVTMMLIVYYPRALHEEETLARSFPDEFSEYKKIPRFFPNLLKFPQALKSDKFSIEKSYENLGLRSLLAIVIVPLLLKLIIHFQMEGVLPRR